MTFDLRTSVDEQLRADWAELAEQVGTRFASRPSYGLSWHRHLARGPLRIATVHRDGRLVALLPLHERSCDFSAMAWVLSPRRWQPTNRP